MNASMRRFSSRSLPVLSCLALAISAALSNAAEPGQDDLTAAEILQRVAETYASWRDGEEVTEPRTLSSALALVAEAGQARAVDRESFGEARPVPPSALRLDLERMTLNDIPLQEHLRTVRGPKGEGDEILGQLMDGFDDAFSPLLGPSTRERRPGTGSYPGSETCSYPGTGILAVSTWSSALSSDSADFTVKLYVSLSTETNYRGAFRGVISGALTANSSLDQVLELLSEPTRWCASPTGSRGGKCFNRQNLLRSDEPVSEQGAIRSYLRLHRGRYETAYVSELHYLRVHQTELDLEIELDEDRTLRAIKVGGHFEDGSFGEKNDLRGAGQRSAGASSSSSIRSLSRRSVRAIKTASPAGVAASPESKGKLSPNGAISSRSPVARSSRAR